MHPHDFIRPLHIASQARVAAGVWHHVSSLTLLQIRARCAAAQKLRQRYVQPLPSTGAATLPASRRSS
jgi:hypothetical protein